MRKKCYSIPKNPDIVADVERVKKWSKEKTDSKAIQFIIRWGTGRLFGR